MIAEFLTVVGPVRALSVPSRYALTTCLVLACFGVRYVLDTPEIGYPYPFLLFLPGIALAALLFDRGTSFYATVLSAGLALYFFIEPRRSFKAEHLSQLVALAVFVAIGFMISGLIEALRKTVDELAEANAKLDAMNRALAVSDEGLSESDALKTAMLQAALDSIITIDEKSRVVEWNKAAEEMFGYPRDEALRRDLADLIIPPEDRQRHYEGMSRYLATGRGPLLGTRVEVEGLHANGSRIVVELAINPTRVRGKPHFVAFVRDIRERKRAEAALRDSEQRLLATYEHAPIGIAEVNWEGRFLRVNEQFCALTGYTREELLKRTFEEITHPDDRALDNDQFGCQMRSEIEGYRLEKRYIHEQGHEVWVGLSCSTVIDAERRPLYAVRVVRNISERKRAEQHRELLINELNHRVKNTLAIVQAVTAQTLRTSDDPLAARDAITARLASLARAHDVLTRESWEGANLAEVVERALETYQEADGARVRARGPGVRLPPAVTLSLSMALHELGTNATKYGALSNDDGHVEIEWEVVGHEDSRVLFSWREIDGPPVVPPTRKGFGTRLIERMLAAETGGEARVSFETNGVTCVMELPLMPAVLPPEVG